MHRLGIRENPLKTGLAMGAERLGRLKLNGRAHGYSPLSRFSELEFLTMGIEAKKQLWTTLRDIAGLDRRLPNVHFDELIARLPSDWHGQLISTVCAAERRPDVVAYLEEKLAPLPDVGPRTVARAIEQMDRCVAQRDALAPAVAAWLRGQGLPSN